MMGLKRRRRYSLVVAIRMIVGPCYNDIKSGPEDKHQ